MNSTAAAVTVIIIVSFFLAIMAGIAGYAFGRAHAGATNVTAEENMSKTLLDCKRKIIIISSLFEFQIRQTEMYADIARQAVEALPDGDSQKTLLERNLQKTDDLLQAKLAEVEEVTKKG